MAVVFHKMHGTGNDFVLLDLRRQSFHVDEVIARRLADRHTGIGCNQLLVLRNPAGESVMADFEIWNADGSIAEQCGNGLRCIGLYLKRGNQIGNDRVLLEGPAGIVELSVIEKGLVSVNMGRPDFDPASIPVTMQRRGDWYELETTVGPVQADAVSMGNPHAVIPVDDVSSAQLRKLGPLIAGHPSFPHGCNAGFARIMNRKTVQLRVFERGSGETLSCGSGACAAAAVLIRAGLTESTVEIIQEGGTLIIEWPGPREHLMMTGPATYVFQGTLS